MEIVLAACCGGFVPALIFGTAVYWLDRYEKEPWHLAVAAFLWGAIPAIILALILQVPIGMAGTSAMVMGVAVAPITEELFKGLAVLLIALIFRREFDSVMDGIVYGSLVGFGFAATENVLYLAGAGLEQGVGAMAVLFVIRALVFGLNHAFFTSLTGIGLAVARLSRNILVRLGAPVVGLAAAMVAHGIHNYGAGMAGDNLAYLGMSLFADWIGILGVLILAMLALYFEHKWMITYLPEEVGLGVISPAQYETALSALRRTSAVIGPLFRLDLAGWRRQQRFYSLCSELTQKKYQCIRLGDQYGDDVARLRNELATLRPQVG